MHYNLKPEKSEGFCVLKNTTQWKEMFLVVFFFVFLQTRLHAEMLTYIQIDMRCKGEGREGWDRGRVEEDFKLTPLWIFPSTVYYNTVSLKTVSL